VIMTPHVYKYIIYSLSGNSIDKHMYTVAKQKQVGIDEINEKFHENSIDMKILRLDGQKIEILPGEKTPGHSLKFLDRVSTNLKKSLNVLRPAQWAADMYEYQQMLEKFSRGSEWTEVKSVELYVPCRRHGDIIVKSIEEGVLPIPLPFRTTQDKIEVIAGVQKPENHFFPQDSTKRLLAQALNEIGSVAFNTFGAYGGSRVDHAAFNSISDEKIILAAMYKNYWYPASTKKNKGKSSTVDSILLNSSEICPSIDITRLMKLNLSLSWVKLMTFDNGQNDENVAIDRIVSLRDNLSFRQGPTGSLMPLSTFAHSDIINLGAGGMNGNSILLYLPNGVLYYVKDSKLYGNVSPIEVAEDSEYLRNFMRTALPGAVPLFSNGDNQNGIKLAKQTSFYGGPPISSQPAVDQSTVSSLFSSGRVFKMIESPKPRQNSLEVIISKFAPSKRNEYTYAEPKATSSKSSSSSMIF
jgi:hypothetical protein